MDRKSVSAAVRAIAAGLAQLADALDADVQTTDELLTLAKLKDEFGLGRAAVKSAATKGLPVVRGSRGALLVKRSDVEAWLKSRRIEASPQLSASLQKAIELTWEQQLDHDLAGAA
jgi:hypothetical protein